MMQQAIFSGSVSANLQYDYFIKDHLGNVRMVLTEEVRKDAYPAATLENVTYNGGTATSVEDDYYSIDLSKVVNQSVATSIPVYQNNNGNPPYNNNPYSNTTANSAKLYQLNATTNTNANKTGLGIVLKVMAGDIIDIFGKSYHKRPSGSGYTLSTNGVVVSELINAFAGAGIVTSKGVTGSDITGQPGFPTLMNGLIGSQPAQSGGRPKASVNWIIFDEQFKYVSGGFDMVGDAGSSTTGTFKSHSLIDLNIPKNGYIYVYVSNESKYNVFFDNLQLFHTRGPILEETHYYPFGLTMQGISSKALSFGELKNKEHTFQDQRFDDDLGLNWVQFKWRNHDPQIGRFIEIDPLSEKFVYNSTYAFSENKVTGHRELEGLESIDVNMEVRRGISQANHAISAHEQAKLMNAYNEGQAKGGVIGMKVAKVLGIGVLMVLQPEIGIPLAVADLSGVPVTPSPQAMSGTVASELSTLTTTAEEVIPAVSLADKARVLTAGGEIGMMDGAATLAVNAKSGYFNIQVTAGAEAGVLSGEIKIVNNAIQFRDLTVTNAQSSSIVGAIDKQGSIGFSTFNKLQKAMTELTKAGGYDKATIEFSKLRPTGSPLPDMPSRTVTLFDNTIKQ